MRAARPGRNGIHLGRTLLIAAVLIACTVTTAATGRDPFDDDRRGFVAGTAIGPGFTYLRARNGSVSRHATRGTLAVDFRVGYAPTERLQFYYTHRTSLFLDDLGDDYERHLDKVSLKTEKGLAYFVLTPFAIGWFLFSTEQHLLGGPAVHYYLNQRAPSWFFETGFGWSAVANPFEDDRPAFESDGMPLALGLFLGGGYEASRHFHLACNVTWSHAVERTTNDRITWDALSASLTASFVGY